MKKIIFILTVTLFFSCKQEPKKQDCDILKHGTFDVYQKDQKVGTVYRKDSLQVETYVGKKITGLTKVKKISKCQYIMRSYWVKKDLDTMNFTINYFMKGNNEIDYEMSPTYVKTEAILRGKIVKVSDSIRADILQKFGKQ
tara:strand:- start:63431 stop:63853 length:423 start_codon:yes stop_codon:yes gene_type:complete